VRFHGKSHKIRFLLRFFAVSFAINLKQINWRAYKKITGFKIETVMSQLENICGVKMIPLPQKKELIVHKKHR
jgi:hypothetical protein